MDKQLCSQYLPGDRWDENMRSLHMHIMMIFMMISLMMLMIFSLQIRRMWAVAVEAHVTSITLFSSSGVN